MKKNYIPLLLALCFSFVSLNAQSVEKWDCFEVTLSGPSSGNPYVDVTLDANFSQGSTSITVPGFYDGNGIYKIRFMPRSEGVWNYTTVSNAPALDGQAGSFTCVPPTGNNRGPVSVRDTFHFQYEDGTPYFENGTTVYGWINQTTALQDRTLETLSQHRFNKIRICIFPKSFNYGNDVEPEHYPVEGTLENWDFTRFNPDFWHNLEMRLNQLQDLGIEADIIVMHPYDSYNGLTFGFKNNQTQEEMERYWDYMIARLACYRNVWWSMANEYHLVGFPDDFWDAMGTFFQNKDPYDHLRSIHNYPGFPKNVFDHNKSWVTHVSYQGDASGLKDGGLELRDRYQKPVVYDEAKYEGDVASSWGQLSGEEMTARYWDATVKGTYLGHGECYLSPDNILWWSRGGSLKGTSPARIDWFDTLMNHIPEKKLEPVSGDEQAAQNGDDYFLYYYGDQTATSRNYNMPAGIDYRVSLLDTWNMTITDKGIQSGSFSITMPNDPYLAVQMYKAGTEPTAPNFIIDSLIANKAYSGNAYTGSIADRAFDPNGDTVSYLKISGPGWLSVAADGTLSGTPSAADIGSNTFTINVSNGNGENDIATMNLLVVSGNESLIQSDDFESGFGNWASGGARCIRVENGDGSYRIRVIQNGDDSTLSSTHDLPLDGYTEVTVEYTFSLANLESGEGHKLEMSTNSGKSWTGVHKIGRGKLTSDDPRNWTTYVDERVTIADYTLTNQTRFRFKGNANGAAKEFSTLDDIRIYASGSIAGGPTPPNNPPVFNVDPINGLDANEDVAYSDTIAGSATDADGDTLTYSKVSGLPWLTIAADGTLSGTPTSSDLGVNYFTVMVADGQGGTDEVQLNITVVAAQALLSIDFDTTKTGSMNTYSGSGITPGNASMMPLPGQSGLWNSLGVGSGDTQSLRTNPVLSNLIDGKGQATSVHFELNYQGLVYRTWEDSSTPDLLGRDVVYTQYGIAGRNLKWRFNGLRPDTQYTIRVFGQVSGSDGWSSNRGYFAVNSSLIPMPLQNYMDFTVVSDSQGQITGRLNSDGTISAMSGLQITSSTTSAFNYQPTFGEDVITVGGASGGSVYSGTIAGTATDVDGDVLSYSKVSGPGWLNVAADGTLSGTPTNSDAGNNVFVIEASDGQGGLAEVQLEIDVTEVSDLISIDFDTTKTGGVNTYAGSDTTPGNAAMVPLAGQEGAWNSLVVGPGDALSLITNPTLSNLIDGQGNTTSVQFELNYEGRVYRTWEDTNANDTLGRDLVYTQLRVAGKNLRWRFSGLSPDTEYTIRIFGQVSGTGNYAVNSGLFSVPANNEFFRMPSVNYIDFTYTSTSTGEITGQLQSNGGVDAMSGLQIISSAFLETD
ncbi:MAG: DUF5060 domain-containing protein [Verrucomicrobiota bacterium]